MTMLDMVLDSHNKPTRKELDDIIEKSLRRAAIWDEVSDRMHDLGTSLSGGQQQRLCIAERSQLSQTSFSWMNLVALLTRLQLQRLKS